MASSRDVDEFVRRLEQRIARQVAGHGRVALAYSGGLASTLVAMVARKRCVLKCVVAGVDGSSDVLAAKAAKAHLDYYVEYAILSPSHVLPLRGRIAAAHRNLDPRELDDLVPLHAALERAEGRPMLSGFGLPPLRAPMVAALKRTGVDCPIHAVARGTTISRSMLRDAATSLGLPVEWARASHRAPAEGAGIREFL